MKKQKFVSTLYGELVTLVRDGVISQEVSEKIKTYYGPVSTEDKIKSLIGILSLLGAFCVGIGVILLFAYNWSNLGRTVKTMLSFLPLMVSWYLIVIAGPEPCESKRESFTVFNILSLGACIALISQIYHLPGDISKFMLSWTLISLPVIYILRSTIGAVLYLVGITVWAILSQISGGHALLFWILLALVLPRFFDVIDEEGDCPKSGAFSFAVLVCFTVALGVVLEKTIPGLWIIVYTSFFAVLFKAPSFLKTDKSLWASPFGIYSNAGVVVLSYILSFSWVWEAIGWAHARNTGKYISSVGGFDVVITGVLLVVACLFLIDFYREENWYKFTYCLVAPLAFFSFFVSSVSSSDVFSVFTFSIFFIILGIVNLYRGVSERSIAKINFGGLILAVIIFTRFVDWGMPILHRAFVFILLGVSFIGVNKYLSKWISKENT